MLITDLGGGRGEIASDGRRRGRGGQEYTPFDLSRDRAPLRVISAEEWIMEYTAAVLRASMPGVG